MGALQPICGATSRRLLSAGPCIADPLHDGLHVSLFEGRRILWGDPDSTDWWIVVSTGTKITARDQIAQSKARDKMLEASYAAADRERASRRPDAWAASTMPMAERRARLVAAMDECPACGDGAAVVPQMSDEAVTKSLVSHGVDP